jgi:YVTN family beta-propeller protein
MRPLGPGDPQRIAGYRVVARLGAGGMGRVYLARSPGGRPVALKVIREDLADDPDFRGRFVREVTAARAVSGAFTAPVVDADPDGHPAWLATGYVAGIGLDEVVRRFGPLPLAAAGALVGGLVEALAAVHAAGLVHRDLKPSNVMLAADGPKVIDFGIATSLSIAATRYTQAGTVIGSPAFFSPEQVAGTAVGPPADIFAMASVVVFGLTGSGPFGSGEPMAVMYRVVNAEPELGDIRGPLRTILSDCLVKDPARRPTTALLIAALEAADIDGTDEGTWQLPAPLTEAIMQRSAALLGAPPAAPIPPAAPETPVVLTAPAASIPPPAPTAPSAPVARPSAGPPYGLGVDLGTTHTAAAVFRSGQATAVPLGGRSHSVPSVLFQRSDGELLVGEAAARRGVVETDRVAREFKRRFGDPVPLLLGEREITAQELTSRLLGWVVEQVTEREGRAPDHVTLTHPATWQQHRTDLLLAAARDAGLSRVGLVPEPVAAAAYYASVERLDPGELLAVYDLGGGTFDATVVAKTEGGFAIRGTPTGDDELGGVDFDQVVLDHVAAALGESWRSLDHADPAVLAGLARVREQATQAKEALSVDVEATVPVILPGISTQVRITRAEFEDAIRAPLLRTIEILARAITAAGADVTDVRAALLIGGSSRIPLVSQLIASELAIPVALDAHPKYATCLGAAIGAAARLAPPTRPAPATPSTRTVATTPTAPTTPSSPSTPPGRAEPTDEAARPARPAAAAGIPVARRPPVVHRRLTEAPPPLPVDLARTGITERIDRTTSAGATGWTGPTPMFPPHPTTPRPPASAPPTPAPGSPPRRRRRWWIPASVAALLAVAAGAAVLLWGQWPESEPPAPSFGIVATIPTGDRTASSIAVSPDGTVATLTDETNLVTLIDTASNAVTGTVTVDASVSQGASRVAFTPDGRFAYVTGHNPVTVIDMSAGAVTATIPVRDGPVEIAVSPDGARVYLSLLNSGEIRVVDTASNTVTSTFQPGGSGTGGALAVAPDGRSLYLCRGGELRVLDASTGAVRTTVPVDGTAQYVVLSRDGQRAYVSTTDPPQVAVVDLAGGAVTATVPGGGPNAYLAISPDDRFVYLADGDDGTLSVIDTGTARVLQTITVLENAAVDLAPDETLFRPFGVAVTPDGRFVYVSTTHGVAVVEVATG